MTKPAISLIVAVYNGEEYLERCLASILRQTFRDIEILCIDDASTDGSADILAAHAARDDRIIIIRHPANRGLGAARNTGIAAARADYVGAVDADDYVAPEMMEKLWAGSENGHFDLVVCGFQRVDPHGHVLSRSMEKVNRVDPLGDGIDVFRFVNPSFWNKIWRRSIYVDNNIRFPESLYYEDAATTPNFMLHARNCNFIGGEYYYYIQRPGSTINSFSPRHIIDYIHVLDNVKEHFIAAGAYDRHKKRFVDYAREQFNFLARTISASPRMTIEEKQRVLRHVRILRESYVAYDDIVRESQRELPA